MIQTIPQVGRRQLRDSEHEGWREGLTPEHEARRGHELAELLAVGRAMLDGAFHGDVETFCDQCDAGEIVLHLVESRTGEIETPLLCPGCSLALLTAAITNRRAAHRQPAVARRTAGRAGVVRCAGTHSMNALRRASSSGPLPRGTALAP